MAYKAIFEGTGLTWFIPWVGDTAEEAHDLQQTLIVTTPLILTALAVAFAFRCGLFNIGGQGQYWVGLMVAIWFGNHFDGAGASRCTWPCSRSSPPRSPALSGAASPAC